MSVWRVCSLAPMVRRASRLSTLAQMVASESFDIPVAVQGVHAVSYLSTFRDESVGNRNDLDCVDWPGAESSAGRTAS
jgi:hypothetical protein